MVEWFWLALQDRLDLVVLYTESQWATSLFVFHAHDPPEGLPRASRDGEGVHVEVLHVADPQEGRDAPEDTGISVLE